MLEPLTRVRAIDQAGRGEGILQYSQAAGSLATGLVIAALGVWRAN